MMMYQVTLSDGFTPVIYHVGAFHDWAMIVVLAVLSFVIVVFFSAISSSFPSMNVETSETLETVWTVLPCFVLAALAGPSLTTLYLSDEVVDPSLTMNVIGHQWYWSYEYEDFSQNEFDSYLVPTSDMWEGGFRLLEVDSRAFLPVGVESRLIITSADVIHSWAVPNLGVNVDAIPGRLNQVSVLPLRSGVIYGQCSEICGANHAFIPICVEILPEERFVQVFN